MAISKQNTTYGLLDRWAEILGVNLFHFNQIAGDGAPYASVDNCNEVWIQPEREMVARALSNAVNKMATALAFYPLPVYFEERIPLGRGSPYQLQHLQTRWGKLVEFGSRATTLIDDAVTVTYSDDDGDGVDDLATISVTSGASTDEIKVFFRTADGAPSAAHQLWEITPLTLSQSGGVTTITGHRSLFVKPTEIWNKPKDTQDPNSREKNDGNTANANHFVTLVDVYRVYTDTTTPLQVYGDPIYTQTTDLDLNAATTGVARIINADLGLFEARIESCNIPTHHIEGVRVFYKAGQALEYGHMEAELEEACIRLANTLMREKPSSLCDVPYQAWETDRQSLKVDNMVIMQEKDLGNPFGLKQGQVAAWHVVADRRVRRGGKATIGLR